LALVHKLQQNSKGTVQLSYTGEQQVHHEKCYP